MAIDRIEIFVTDLPGRLQRRTSSGAYDTGPKGSLMGKPVLVKLHADGVTGYGQIRPTAPGRFMADTVHSIVGAITDIYGPRLLGKELGDLELAWSMFDRSLPVNNNARALLDHALHDALGKSLGVPGVPAAGRPGAAGDSAGMVRQHGGRRRRDDRALPARAG